MHFDLVDLRLFLRVSEQGSITAGAREANLALASASQRIRAMEDTLGVALLRREHRGVSLTPAGNSLADHARLLLQQVERMNSDLTAHSQGLRGGVRLLCNTAALSEHLPATLARFLAANPTLDLDVDEMESPRIVEAIARGSGDIGIAVADVIPPGLESWPYEQDHLAVLLPERHALAGRTAVAFAEIVGEDFVGLTRPSALQTHLAGQAAKLGQRLRLRASMKDFDSLHRLVEAGVGLAIVPRAAIRRWGTLTGTTAVDLGEPWARRDLRLCVRTPDRLTAPARALLDHLRGGGRP